MSLIKVIVAEFEKALTEVFKREAEDKNYMNQSILGCRWRAFWGIFVACMKSIKPMVNILALSIAKHREIEHEEDKSKTIASLTRSLGDEKAEEVIGADTKAFWSFG